MIGIDEQKKELSKAVGLRIKYLRHTKFLSQEDLALRANLNPAYYGQVERGLKCPTIDTLHKIAKALEVPLPELLKTEPMPEYSENYNHRIQELLAKVPDDKINQVFKILEEIIVLL